MGKLHTLPRARRLSGATAFQRVFAGRCSAANALLVVYAWPNGLPHSRLGLSVGRRHGGAVRRNRIKRLVREAFRLETAALPTGFDFVCVPRVGDLPTLDDCRRAVVGLARQASDRAAGKSRRSSNQRDAGGPTGA